MSMNSPYKVIVKEPSAALKKKMTKPGRKHFIVIGPDGEESLRWWSNNSEEADSDCSRLNAAYAKGVAAQAQELDRLRERVRVLDEECQKRCEDQNADSRLRAEQRFERDEARDALDASVELNTLLHEELAAARADCAEMYVRDVHWCNLLKFIDREWPSMGHLVNAAHGDRAPVESATQSVAAIKRMLDEDRERIERGPLRGNPGHALADELARLRRLDAANRSDEFLRGVVGPMPTSTKPMDAILIYRGALAAQANAGLEAKPTVVCLCGSTRFKPAFDEANYTETMAGKIVLSVGFFMHATGNRHGEDVGATPEQKLALDDLHLRKIDLADEVLVLNVGGYIGESTAREIQYAQTTGKPIRYLEDAAPATNAGLEQMGVPRATPKPDAHAKQQTERHCPQCDVYHDTIYCPGCGTEMEDVPVETYAPAEQPQPTHWAWQHSNTVSCGHDPQWLTQMRDGEALRVIAADMADTTPADRETILAAFQPKPAPAEQPKPVSPRYADDQTCPQCGSKQWDSGGPLGAHCCRCDADFAPAPAEQPARVITQALLAAYERLETHTRLCAALWPVNSFAKDPEAAEIAQSREQILRDIEAAKEKNDG